MECLAEGTVLGFVAGKLSPEATVEVDEHVASCASCRQLLVAVANGSGAESFARTVPLRSDLDLAESPTMAADGEIAASARSSTGIARGTAVGRYMILDVLGRGGMGVVYAAFDPELARKVAVKVLHTDSANEGAAARLLREGRAIARLAHPNVVTVFDVGKYESSVFVAMELVDGMSLDGWLATPRSVRDVVAVFLQAGAGLVAAHAAGMVHRDFKPANVLVGNDGRSRVTDFGLAQLGERTSKPEVRQPHDEATSSRLTRTGTIMGTPAYMAPEQFEAGPVDPRSDQFSFAVALYEGLYGERPFSGKTITALYEAIDANRVSPAPAGTKVPSWLRQVVLRGLRAAPAERYPMLQDMLAALRRDPAIVRRRVLLGAAGASLLGLTVAVTLMVRTEDAVCSGGEARLSAVWSPARAERISAKLAALKLAWTAPVWAEAQRQLDAWGESFVAGYVDACEATHERQEQSPAVLDARMRCLDERLREVDAYLNAMETAGADSIEKGARSAADLPAVSSCANLTWVTQRAAPPTDPGPARAYATFQAALERAKALRRLGRVAESSKELDAIAPEIVAAPAAVRAPYLLERGEALFGAGRYDDARRELWKAAQDMPSSKDAELGFRVWRALAAVEVTVRKLDEAQRFADLARGQLEALGKPPALEADLEKILGIIASNAGRNEAAIVHFERARAVNEKGPGDRRVQLGEDELNLSSEYIRLKRFAEANAHIERAIALREELYGKDHLLAAAPLNNLSVVLREQKKLAEALAVSRRVVAIREKYLPPDHLDLAKAWNGLGRVLDELDDLDGALAAFEKSVDIRIRATNDKNPEVAMTRLNIGGVLEKRGALDEADAQYAASIAALADAKDPSFPAQVYLARGMLQLVRKQYQAATASLERSLELYRSTLPPDHTTLCWVYSSLGQARVELRAHQQSLEPLDNAIACYRKRTNRREQDDQELEVTQFFKGRALFEAKRDRVNSMPLISDAWRWAHEHHDDQLVTTIRSWAATAGVRLPKISPAP